MGVSKKMAPQVLAHPEARTTESFWRFTVIERSLAHPAHPVVPEEIRERGQCSECDTTTKTLTAPHPNVGHCYTGPMYCLACNPRFFTLDAQWSCLERMVS
jgi:hypothetical protein